MRPQLTYLTESAFDDETPGTPAGGESRTWIVPDDIDPVILFGSHDEVLRAVDRGFPRLLMVPRGHELLMRGESGEVDLAARILDELVDVTRAGKSVTADAVERAIQMLRALPGTAAGGAAAAARGLDRQHGARAAFDAADDVSGAEYAVVDGRRAGAGLVGGGLAGGDLAAQLLTADILSAQGKTIRPKTLGQKAYVDAIDENTIVFGIGPAGTGKTFLAMAKAVVALQTRQVSRIILTRPAVEAGESLGFLPGTLNDKIDPYLRPLYDALHSMIDSDSIPKLMAAGTIEVAPLAYMRGRTLNDAFIILDEAQNTTPEQMKMFLTRLGFGSTIVVTGDVTQVDLPGGQRSGLRVVQEILTDIEGIAFCRLTSADVVRHRLVGEIIDAYERYDTLHQAATANRQRGTK